VGAQEEVAVREWAVPTDCYDTDSGRLLEFVVQRTSEVLAQRGR
jgi:hypothetical protein